MVRYESLIKILEKEGCMQLPGDLLEIGAFVGGGTRKLACYARQFSKKVYAIDVFNPLSDLTVNEKGVKMSDLYSDTLQRLGLTMFEAYWFNTCRCHNIITIPKDSKKVRFPSNLKFCFAFINGNHSPDYVINDYH